MRDHAGGQSSDWGAPASCKPQSVSLGVQGKPTRERAFQPEGQKSCGGKHTSSRQIQTPESPAVFFRKLVPLRGATDSFEPLLQERKLWGLTTCFHREHLHEMLLHFFYLSGRVIAQKKVEAVRLDGDMAVSG